MNYWQIGATAWLAAIAGAAAYASEGAYTPTHGPSCVGRSWVEFETWRCPGPSGYVVEYTDEGNLAGIAIWAPTGKRQVPSATSWRGSGKVFGDRLEWRLDGGQPKAAILRIWRVDTATQGGEHEVEELILLKTLPAGACRVASIKARQAGANEMIQTLSAQVSSLPCLNEE